MTTRESRHNHIPQANPKKMLLEALRSNLSLLGELAARYQVSTRPDIPDNPTFIGSPRDVHLLLEQEMSDLAQEQLRVLLLNSRHQVVGQRTIYQGTVHSSQVRTAEVLRPAVIEAVPSIIVAHNHPSGTVEPSPNDVAVTRKLKQAGDLLDIDLLDHVVIGRGKFASLKDMGLFPW